MKATIAWTLAACLCALALAGCQEDREEEPERLEERAAVTYGGELMGERTRGTEPTEQRAEPAPRPEQQQQQTSSQVADLDELRLQVEQQHEQIRTDMTMEHEAIQTQMAGEHDLIQERLDDLGETVEAGAMVVEVEPAGRRIQAERRAPAAADEGQRQTPRGPELGDQDRPDVMMQRYGTMRDTLEALAERARPEAGELDARTRELVAEAYLQLDALESIIGEVRNAEPAEMADLDTARLEAERRVLESLEVLHEHLRGEEPAQSPGGPLFDDDLGTPLEPPETPEE